MNVAWKLDDLVGPGTSYRGMIVTSFDKIVEVFGEPNCESSDKVWNEWSLTFELGNVADDEWDVVDATIYDWKELHASDSHIGEYQWHIGGRDHRSVELVYEALGK